MRQLSDYLLSVSNNQGYMIWIWILAISFITYLITRYIILRAISNLFRKTSTDLDDILIDKGLFNRLSYIVPLLIIYNLIYFLLVLLS